MNVTQKNHPLFNLGDKWLENELRHADLGDERLNKRLIKTSLLMEKKAAGSINQSCKKSKESKGAYRLAANEKFDVDEVLSSHQKETAQRVKGHKRVFCIQDTTYLDYDSHKKTKGLGSIGKAHSKHSMGLINHSAMLVSQKGLPLGLSSQEYWARPVREATLKEQEKRKYHTPAKKKESYKWTKALENTKNMLPEGTKIISVCDREADVFSFLSAHASMGASYVVRNRSTRNFISSEGEETNLETYLKNSPPKKKMVLKIPKKKQQKARKAKVELKYITGHIAAGPRAKRQNLDDKLAVHIVSVQEVNPPKGVEEIDWVLITNVPVNNIKDAMERIEWYKMRWKIEEYFKVLKSGCNIEALRLSTGERLERIIAIKSILAFKILYLSKVASLYPGESCAKIMSTKEWKTLYIREHEANKLPTEPPTVKEVIVWLGKLGGFMNRKSDKLPGIVTLWRGYESLNESVAMYEIFNS